MTVHPKLTAELGAIKFALNDVAYPSDKMLAIIEQQRKLELKLKTWREQPEAAVNAYNRARRLLVVKAALAKKLGWCSHGSHFAGLDALEGVIKSGAYVTSGYYENLRDYQQRGTVCKDCRRKLRGSSGRYDGEFTSYHTFELKDAKASLDGLQSDYRLERLAKEVFDIDLPPSAHYDRLNGVTIGDQTLLADDVKPQG